MEPHPSQAADVILKKCAGFKPKLGLILGSGLSSLADQIQNPIIIPYSELPGFPVSTVAGHKGCLVLGHLNDMPVACMQGRIHPYEGAPYSTFKSIIRTFKLIGCDTLILTNASGSLREHVGPGRLMLITDHINLHYGNPLIGHNDEEFGPRFFAMDNAYDPALRKRFHKIAETLEIKLAEGVYVGVPGPNFETPAEIRMYRLIGGDAVGMSTIPEVIVARHCGLRVAAVAAVTNFAAGMSSEEITHEGTLHYGQIAAKDMARLITTVAESLHRDPC